MKLSNNDKNILDFGSLKNCFMEILNKVAPLKTKCLRANDSKFVTKDVSKSCHVKNQTVKSVFKEGDNRVNLSQSCQKSEAKLLRKFKFERH